MTSAQRGTTQLPLRLRWTDAKAFAACKVGEQIQCARLHCTLSVAACVTRQGYDVATGATSDKRAKDGQADDVCRSADGCWQGKALLADLGIWRWERCCGGRCGGRTPVPRLAQAPTQRATVQ